MDHFVKTHIGFLVIIFHMLAVEQRCLILSNQDIFSRDHCISFADLLAIFCIHCTLSSCRWTHVLFRDRSPAWFIEWIVDQFISVALSLFLFNHVWSPFIDSTTILTISLGKHLIHYNHCLSSSKLHSLAKWLEINASTAIPCLGASWVLYAMLKLTGQWCYFLTFLSTLGELLTIMLRNLVELVWPFGRMCSKSHQCCDIENNRPTIKLSKRTIPRTRQY